MQFYNCFRSYLFIIGQDIVKKRTGLLLVLVYVINKLEIIIYGLPCTIYTRLKKVILNKNLLLDIKRVVTIIRLQPYNL